MPDAPRVQTPALIERHVPLSDPPFFRVEYLSHLDPPEWQPSRVGALVLDYMAADTAARKLGSHVYATTVVTSSDRAKEIEPRHRSQREDWRAHVPNSGVL